MIRLAVAAGVLALGTSFSSSMAAENANDAAAFANANNGAAVAALKAETVANPWPEAMDANNSQLTSRDLASALAGNTAAAIGSHALSVAAPEGALGQGLLNVRIEASALVAEPRIGASKASDTALTTALQRTDTRDFLK